MTYQDDYEAAAAEIKVAIEELKRSESRVLSLQRRMAALQALIALDNPDAARQETASAELASFTAPRIADRIRGILTAASPNALTVREIRDELRQAGIDLMDRSNPASTIGSVCASLVDQRFAEVAPDKNGRRAWRKLK